MGEDILVKTTTFTQLDSFQDLQLLQTAHLPSTATDRFRTETCQFISVTSGIYNHYLIRRTAPAVVLCGAVAPIPRAGRTAPNPGNQEARGSTCSRSLGGRTCRRGSGGGPRRTFKKREKKNEHTCVTMNQITLSIHTNIGLGYSRRILECLREG